MLFLSSSIIKNYKIDEFIRIIRKMQDELIIYFFKDENIKVNLKEDKLKIYTSSMIEWAFLEKELTSIQEVEKTKNSSKIIAISGANGSGKSTFSTFFAKNVENENLKTLLIDFDLEDSQIRTLLKIKKYPQNCGDLENMIFNVKKNLDVICYLDGMFENKNQIDFFKIQELFKKVKEEYDLIIIDTSSKLYNEYTKRIFYNSDKIIFLLEPNILGIKKSKTLLEVFENDWKISNKKIKLILNKTGIYQVSDKIIQEIFPEYELLGKMKYNDAYNLMINKNIQKREIKMEYENILKKI